ncbi:MAG TPA: hypothetical protein VF407_22405 [Polyangiaceae bacterium]
MTKEGQKRFCDACKKHVHDLSSMTPPEARALLDAPSAEGLCVRYLYDAEGNILFTPTDALIKPSALARARRFVTAAGALAIPLSLNACMGARMAEPEPMMGAVAVPENPPPTANDADAGDAGDYPVMMGAPAGPIAPPQTAPQATPVTPAAK